MGAYLSKPVTEKQTECGGNERARYAATTMQGWRINQEDAHNCIADFDERCSFFAVYDGHGGSEVAQYTAQHLPDMLKANSSWFAGNFAKAIEDTFLEFDERLRSEIVMKELKKMAGTVAPKPEEPSDDDEDKQVLYEEASMPLETLLQKYGVFLHRDRNGKQSMINMEELRTMEKFRTQIGREKEEETEGKGEESDEGIEENGSNNSMEQETNGKEEQNGNAVDEDKQELKAAGVGIGPAEKKAAEEKTKKRASDAAPSSFYAAKRTRSSDDLGEASSEDQRANSSSSSSTAAVDDKPETKTKDGRCETATAGDDEAAKSELEVAGPADVSSSTAAASKNSPAGDACMSSSENPTQPSATSPDGQNAFSSDSEQSVDEDYNVEEEMSEGEVEEEEEDEESEADDVEQAYSCPPGDTPGEDSGTTACVTILFKDKIIVGNVGDSRAVLSRNGTAIELSVDHKPEDETERRRIQAAGGSISPDGRVNGGLNLSRALGDHFYKKNDSLPLKEQMISALPDVKEYKITDDDEFIIVACDGIWNSLTSQEAVDFIRQRINDNVNLKDICEQICDHCLSPNTAGDGTGCDNMTIIVAQILCPTPSAPQ